MLNGIRNYFDRRAVMNTLPAVLLDRYGAKASYTDGQVMKALELAGVNPRALAYAAAVFMTREDAIALLEHESVYLRARQALAAHYYNGDTSFAVDLRGPLARQDVTSNVPSVTADSSS